jgi:hypothetical protein
MKRRDSQSTLTEKTMEVLTASLDFGPNPEKNNRRDFEVAYRLFRPSLFSDVATGERPWGLLIPFLLIRVTTPVLLLNDLHREWKNESQMKGLPGVILAPLLVMFFWLNTMKRIQIKARGHDLLAGFARLPHRWAGGLGQITALFVDPLTAFLFTGYALQSASLRDLLLCLLVCLFISVFDRLSAQLPSFKDVIDVQVDLEYRYDWAARSRPQSAHSVVSKLLELNRRQQTKTWNPSEHIPTHFVLVGLIAAWVFFLLSMTVLSPLYVLFFHA